MSENISPYAWMGYVECERRQPDGFRRIFVRKVLPDHGPTVSRSQ